MQGMRRLTFTEWLSGHRGSFAEPIPCWLTISLTISFMLTALLVAAWVCFAYSRVSRSWVSFSTQTRVRCLLKWRVGGSLSTHLHLPAWELCWLSQCRWESQILLHWSTAFSEQIASHQVSLRVFCSTFFGKLGRFCTGAIRERQYSTAASSSLTPLQLLSSKMMKHLVQVGPKRNCRSPRHMSCHSLHRCFGRPAKGPLIRIEGVLIIQEPFRVEYFSIAPGMELVSNGLTRENFMGGF